MIQCNETLQYCNFSWLWRIDFCISKVTPYVYVGSMFVFFVIQLGYVTLTDSVSALRCQHCKPKVRGRAGWLKMPQWKIQTVVWGELCLMWNTRQAVGQLGPSQVKVFWWCHRCDHIATAQDFKPKTLKGSGHAYLTELKCDPFATNTSSMEALATFRHSCNRSGVWRRERTPPSVNTMEANCGHVFECSEKR